MEGWNWKHIYAMLADDGKVKIGISKCVHDRVRKIENSKGVKITDYSYTEKCSNPYMIEQMIHEELKDFRHFGEWFTVTFEHAVSTMKVGTLGRRLNRCFQCLKLTGHITRKISIQLCLK